MRKADQHRKRDRDDRAKVVAVRLSVWLREVNALITAKLDDSNKITSGLTSGTRVYSRQELSDLLKLNVPGTIEDVMSDLHYLRTGSSDVAQLDYFIKEFDSYIDKAAGVIERVRLYPELEKRLMNLKQLCTNASRHIDPSIQAP
jgi:hypothetical protein